MSSIETKSNKIMESLIPDLLKSGAIDGKHRIVKNQMFLDIIEYKEQEINELFDLVEKNGVITDRNGSEIIYGKLRILKDMKTKMSLTPYKTEFKVKQKEPTKTSGFQSGIFNIFRRSKKNISTNTRHR